MKRLPSTLLAVGLTAWCTFAHAQALTPQDEANARFQAGLKYYDARDFESARLAFTQAYAVMQKPGILLNLGLSEVYAGHYVEGLEHLDAWLKDPSTPAEKKERAKKGYDEGYKKTGHLAVRTAREAEVKIDGKAVSPGASLVHVVPGPHKVEAHLGDKTKSVEADAPAGVERTVELAFDNAPLAPAPTSAMTPPVDGSHVEPPAEEPARESFWGIRSIAGLVLIAGGGVALGVGFAAKGTENDQKDKIPQLSAGLAPGACASASTPQCTALSDALSSRDSASSRATTSFIIGGVALGAGAALVASAIVWPHRRTAFTLLPVGGPQQAGLLLHSNF